MHGVHKRLPIFGRYFEVSELLPDTQAGLNDIDYIVAEFLTLVDEVDVDGTLGIGIFMVVHINDVLCLELIAVVVDLVLDIERAVDVVRLLAARHQLVHLDKRLVGESHHLMQVIVLFLVEVILLGRKLAVDGTGHIVAGIAD